MDELRELAVRTAVSALALALMCGCAGSGGASPELAGAGGGGAAFTSGMGAVAGGGAGHAAVGDADAAGGAARGDGSVDEGAFDAGPPDASAFDATIDAASTPEPTFITGVNVHAYPKPTAYGYTAADGADRMGNALVSLGAVHVRGPAIGETTFLARLATFGVRRAVLGLDAKAYGKPFDAAQLGTALDNSIAAAKSAGIEVEVEGLNEWDLFNAKSYNAGVIPPGKSVSDFVLITQRALYEAAHPKGIQVLGPSVGHGTQQSSLDLFPDVSAYVDIVNMHLYYGTSPETLPIADQVLAHQKFQGAGKPVWITETGVSVYNGVSLDGQADIIGRGLAAFANSGLIAAAFNYELIDQQLPGLSGSTYVPESAEYHFGLFAYGGTEKPSAAVVRDFIAAH